MKLTQYLILAFLIGSNWMLAQDYNSGLTAYYPFDGNANDVSGNNHHGIVSGATLTTNKFGQPNKAYHFDGIDDYIRILNAAHLSNYLNGITLSAWIKKSSYTNLESIIAKWYQTSVGDTYAMFLVQAALYPLTSAATGNHDTYSVGNLVDEWFMVTYTHDAVTGEQLYINGVSVLSNGITGGIISSPNDVYIGADFNSGDSSIWRFFAGEMDQVRIYSRGLSNADVAALYAFENSGQLSSNLTAFTGRIVGNRVQLQWKVTNPVQWVQFEVENSANGQTFTQVGQFRARPHRTNYNHWTALLPQSSYYRLKMIDTSGNYAYSEVIQVTGCTIHALQLSPNPIRNVLQVDVETTGDLNGEVELTVIDALGRSIIQQSVSNLNSTLPLDALQNGGYFLRMVYGNQIITQRFYKLD